MQVKSINFVKLGDVPKTQKNTELAQVTQQIADSLKKAPAGNAICLELDSVKRWTSYAIKRALAARHNLTVQVVNSGGKMYIAEAPAKGKK